VKKKNKKKVGNVRFEPKTIGVVAVMHNRYTSDYAIHAV